jgi:hypothetical protein
LNEGKSDETAREEALRKHEEALYISDIMHERGHFTFGMLLRRLCDYANITIPKMVEESKALRNQWFVLGYHRQGYSLGSLEDDIFYKVVKGEQWPSTDQVATWLSVLEKTFESEEYIKSREEHNLPVFKWSYEVKKEMYHLAGLATPEEQKEAFEASIPKLTDTTYLKKSGKRAPIRQGSYSKRPQKGYEEKHSQLSLQEEI